MIGEQITMSVQQSTFLGDDAMPAPGTTISQEEINATLWRACDTFRGTVDPSEYKNYILVMLFIKYISDVWADHYATALSLYNGDIERVQRRMARERFVLPPDCDFAGLHARRREENIGEQINIALEKIEDANREKLDGVFRNIDFNSEANLGKTRDRNERLRQLLEDFANPRLDLRPSRIGNLDIIGNAYEYLIARFASGAGKKAGEFYTPPEVSELLAELLDPQPGERICDPACGSGSLLIKCARRVGGDNFALYGQESNGSTWALAMMNMFLHGIDQTRIEWGDTLRYPLLIEGDHLMHFEVVVANPPFSLDKWGADVAPADRFRRFHRGIPPKGKGDYAFIQHMIETTDPYHGRVGVIVPHGVLFRATAGSTARLRQRRELPLCRAAIPPARGDRRGGGRPPGPHDPDGDAARPRRSGGDPRGARRLVRGGGAADLRGTAGGLLPARGAARRPLPHPGDPPAGDPLGELQPGGRDHAQSAAHPGPSPVH